MTNNPKKPREDDAVLGGQNTPLVNAAILGGIEGVKRRLANPQVEVRVAALKNAIDYGEAGLDLIIQALQDEAKQVKFTAYSLLKDRTEPKVKHKLHNFLPFFDYDVITVNEFGQENSRRREFAQYFTEDLGNGVFLEMVLIPGGTFLMGSPETEKGRGNNESPQHKVTVPPFFMGKYLVTQAQWEAVAALPEVNIYLNPDPSHFKGENQPVEWVTWYETVEFCARLSRKSGRDYRLPGEAEWEYACRAGTTTPFHFGETITTKLANYHGKKTYASEAQGTWRFKTTPVGSFPPNAFGLYDMHGNVCELCADSWHKTYEGAPSDGSVWQNNSNNHYRPTRGGSLHNNPEFCRSAVRDYFEPDLIKDFIGFRVVCAATWTQ